MVGRTYCTQNWIGWLEERPDNAHRATSGIFYAGVVMSSNFVPTGNPLSVCGTVLLFPTECLHVRCRSTIAIDCAFFNAFKPS